MILIVFIMKTLIIMIMMMINIEKLEALEDYLQSLLAIITNQ